MSELIINNDNLEELKKNQIITYEYNELKLLKQYDKLIIDLPNLINLDI